MFFCFQKEKKNGKTSKEEKKIYKISKSILKHKKNQKCY